MEGHTVQPAERTPTIKEYLARWKPDIHPVKSAEEEFQEKLKEYQDLFNSLTDSSQKFNRMPEIMDCGGRITQLKDTKQDKEREYRQKLCDQQEALLCEAFGLVDLELIDEIFNDWCHGRAQPSSTAPTQSATGIPGTIEIEQPQDTTISRFTPITDQPTSTRNSMPSPPNSDISRETSTRPSELDRPDHNTSAGPQKRPANPVVARQPKRPRSDVTLGPLTGERTIEYDQVYQNGKAEPKYNIARFEGFYYILECKAHRMHFHKDPLRGASKHLRGKKHNQRCVSYGEAIRALGIRVLNCDEKKAKDNNDVAQRPTYSQMGRPLTSLSPSAGRDIPTRSNQSLAAIDPKPGEVYTTFWSGTKEFFAILVLPWINCGQLGPDLPLTVQDTELIDNVPTCYRYNQADDSFEWAPEYLPGGQHYSKREYPIMYFDAPVFPGQCRLKWIPACEFDLYDPKVPTLQFKDIVDGYIASRDNGIQESDYNTLVQRENNRGDPTIDAPTAEIFPREHSSDAREIILIDDDSDDDTADHNLWPSSSIGSDDPAPKTEPSDEAMTDIHDQQVATTTCDNTPSQPILSTFNPTQLYNGLFDSQVPNEAVPGCPPSCDTQAQTPIHDPTPQWPPAFLHEPSPIDSTNLHHEQLPQPMPFDTRAPEAIMAPLPTNQIAAPIPGPSDNSQMQPTAQPCQGAQATELYSYLSQARNASSQFQLDSDGRLRWIAPKALSGLATKQKPMSVRQHEEVRARIQAIGKEPQPTQQQASMSDSQQTSYVTPHGFKRSF
ncbi:uncharacterized protein FIESC28_03449 [Fusarium coffeatum]|uniref:Uncharacterized protein n=1 Tax=Fusarium coffeatum TaxID=231269 RepID=A0A366S351_9HYPO|nr:uncharacterized protein FIESC28_03449 [Fusarium coffeatum]RBR23744.1 hypothetical protein FIESC28_03449 [Fusarium coffeatum]